METYKFKAVPTDIRYYNEESAWGCYIFNTNDDIPQTKEGYNGVKIGTLAGKMQMLSLGLEYEVTATLEYNKKYQKYNYVPQTVISIKPKTKDQQARFLETIVTKRQAESILSAYPNVVEDVVDGKEIDVNKIKGVGEKTWESIKFRIEKNYVISDILTLLSPLGISIQSIQKLLNYENNPVLLKQKLKTNPYILTKINGIGFKKADEIALKITPSIKVSNYRVVAFVRWYLNSIANDNGDTWVYRITLDNAVRDNINECYELYEKFMQEQEFGGKMLVLKEDKVGLKYIYDTEYAVVKKLDELNSVEPAWDIDIDKGIKQAEQELGFRYTDEQKKTIRDCCEKNVVIITGQAGTGKSTILRGLVDIYKNYKIFCCALSAKAVQRIIEATGHSAKTIHRLLGYSNGSFVFNEKMPLQCDMLVLDEASMVNSEIFLSLLSAVKQGTKVIICGDDEQLPPIGSANIFHDLLRMDRYACVKLTKILRQAERSGIITDSRKIRQNEYPIESPDPHIVTGELQDMTYVFRNDKEKMRSLAINTYLKTVEKNGIDNTIIITPCKQHRVNSTEELNKIVQDKLIPASSPSVSIGKKEFRVGAKVIQRVNDYEKNVFNGEIGKVIEISDKDKKRGTLTSVKFSDNKVIEYTRSELASLELAYALTVHVTQGSGYDNVIILIDSSHYKLLDSCLLYTAVTRAKKKCLLISEPSAFSMCIKNKASERKTWLSLERKSLL